MILAKLLRYAAILLTWAFATITTTVAVTVRLIHRVWTFFTLHISAWVPILVISARAFFQRRRMSHDNGVLTRGTIKFRKGTDLPENDFFVPDRLDYCRCRFSSIEFQDDARLVARGAALKFRDARGWSPLDLMMNTGRTTPFNSIRSFWGYMWASLRGKGPDAIRYMQIDPARYVGSVGRLRRNPESFALLEYNSKLPYVMALGDGSRSYVKFRLAPENDGVETGIPNEDDLTDWAWCLQGVAPGETRGRNYLKNELRERIRKAPIRLRLQMQMRPVHPDDRRECIDPGLEWNEDEFPFRTVADVQLDEQLDHKESALTRFETRNRPKCMTVPWPRSVDDPAGLHYLRALSVLPRWARIVSVRIFGILHEGPDERNIDETPHTPYFTPLKLGEPETLLLPQKEEPIERAVRRQALKATRERYPIEVPQDMPSFCNQLPPEEEFDNTQSSRMFSNITATVADLGLAGLGRTDRGARTLATWDSYYPLRALPAVHDRWRSDVEFGRQRLNGVNPALIERCDELPAKFPVTNSMVDDLLPDGTSLGREIKAGRIFITDHKILDGLPTHDNAFLTAPICLFHVAPDGALLPLAIQLGQQPKCKVRDETVRLPIFTPLDPPWLWLTVKTHVQCADAAFHEVYTHLMRTHMMSEAVYVSARRTLSDRHPVMEILAPHFHDTLAINAAARKDMLAPKGPLPRTMAAGYDGTIELLKRAFDGYWFEDVNLRVDLEKRGLLDRYGDGAYVLPEFYYRDDGLRVHGLIREWVEQILGRFYRNASDIKSDDELQEFFDELEDRDRGNVNGIPHDGDFDRRQKFDGESGTGKGKRKGKGIVPRDRDSRYPARAGATAPLDQVDRPYKTGIKSVNDLIDFVTQLIFTASAEHSAVNNGQYDYFGYVPNVPGALHKPPPLTKDELSEESLVETLPSPTNSSIQIAMVHLLSTAADWPLGHYPYGFFQGHPDVAQATKRFRAKLDHLSVEIRSRNAIAEVPYPYLDPRLMGKSTLI